MSEDADVGGRSPTKVRDTLSVEFVPRLLTLQGRPGVCLDVDRLQISRKGFSLPRKGAAKSFLQTSDFP